MPIRHVVQTRTIKSYLDNKNRICKNKLIDRVIEECTSVVIKTMVNNKDNIENDNTIVNDKR